MAAVATTLGQALADAAMRLREAGIERARAEARLLAAGALGLSLEAVVAQDRRILCAGDLQAIRALAERRARRAPVAQILGWREFYGRRFKITSDVLTPRPDSETLIDAVLDRVPDRQRRLSILDLGVGSGCLLLTLLGELPAATGVGVDRSARALAVAAANAESLGLARRCRLIEGNWLSPIEGAFDLVVCNPPYIPTADIPGLDPEVSQYEPVMALDGGADGLDCYRVLAAGIVGALAPQGVAALEVGQGQAGAVARILADAGAVVVGLCRDLAGIERCVLATRPCSKARESTSNISE